MIIVGQKKIANNYQLLILTIVIGTQAMKELII